MSEFTLHLPLGGSTQSEIQLLSREGAEKQVENTAANGGTRFSGRILAAEEIRTNRILLERLLTRAGACVDLVTDGDEVVERYRNAKDAGEFYDAVLLDVQMPRMSGKDAARAIRANGFEGPIIAITANALADDRRACIEAGSDVVEMKPIDGKRLLKTLQGLMSKGESSSSANV